ncbi:MAG: F0F1 ATP synthase subunit gamma, partial [Terriglobia bacterium]
GEYVNFFQHRVEFSSAQQIAARVIELYGKRETDAVDLIYNEFKSLLSATLAEVRLLPFKPDKPPEGETWVDYIYEQPPEEIFAALLPRYVESEIYRALLESQAAEYAAKMTAMDTATNNAGDLIDSLTLHLNRVRQGAITKEIIEIVSGASAI